MEENKEKFFDLGNQFQESLAQLILEDRAFADQIGEVLQSTYFNLKYIKTFVEKVYEYKTKYNNHPTVDIFEAYIHSEFKKKDLVREQIKSFIERIRKKDIADVAYIKEHSIKFCKQEKIKEAVMRSMELIARQEYDHVEKLISEAINSAQEKPTGHDYVQDFEKRYSEDYRPNIVPTGWPVLNSYMNGGLAAGELGVIIAPTGMGKTWILSHLGMAAVRQGLNVIHFILELNESKIGKRYDSLMTGIPLNELDNSKGVVWEQVNQVPGKLEIVKYISKKATVRTLHNRIEKLKKHKFKPDLIIVDYGDLLLPVVSEERKTDNLQSIFEDLQILGEDFECPTWTATQTNRSGIRSEIIELDQVADAYAKCFRASLILTLSRRPEDVEANTARLFLAKSNIGPDKVVLPMIFGTKEISKIDILPADTYELAEAPIAKTQQERLKDAYEKYKYGH